jgi:hypothetical protein
MRGLFFLSAVAIVLLAFDASEFDGYYRRAVWIEACNQVGMLRYTVARYVSSYVEDAENNHR